MDLEGHIAGERRRKSPAHVRNRTHNLFVVRCALYHRSTIAAQEVIVTSHNLAALQLN